MARRIGSWFSSGVNPLRVLTKAAVSAPELEDAHGGHRLPELDKVTNSLRGDFVWLKSAQSFR
jgi:hypothetical protein